MVVDVAIFILLLYFGFATTYLFVLAVFSLLKEKKFLPATDKLNRYAILIPNYRENRIILDVARTALNHDYPKDYFDVYVIADGVEPETVSKLKDMGCYVIEVQFENSTKAKSLNAALCAIDQEKYDYAVVLDVDNIMQPGFLHQVNIVHNCGYKVVQGHRTAKNINTNTAYLDALSEESANSLIRRGIFRIGGSAMIIGSAFSIEWNLFKRLMSDIQDVAGEDRELEIRILEQKIKIAYCSSAVVLDEKVENWGNYTRQRSRWAAAHLDFVLKYFTRGFSQLFNGNFDY
ncbi:MAG TPA: glycosyltransferase family 2 protein, partial [Candidatus Kapabacteria bacterium]|nr:glycosyltransferase family 2 protein [Candidatus Kapabacteria bacterium]